jgi:glycosyltransferase involved in cell wall biosynthesis
MKKSVLLLSFSPLRRDPRVLRQLKILREEYSVATCGFGPAPDAVEEHYEIPLSESGWWPKELRYAGAYLASRNFGTFYRHEPRVQFVLRNVPHGQFDIIIANDVNTVPLAQLLKPRCGIHADLHEWEPRSPGSGMNWRIMGLPYSRWHLRRVKEVASVTTVAPGLAQAYQRKYGISAQVVTNAADYVETAPSQVGRQLRFVHSGGSNPSRRLDLMIDAMRGVEGATLEFMLMSTGEGAVEALKEYAADVPNITFRDPVPYSQLVETLGDYDVGLFLLPPTNYNYEMALPNKLFEYVQARLAIVISPSPEMARIVTEHELGLVAEDFSADAFRTALQSLTPEAVQKFKENSHKAARELSSESAVRPWLEAVRAIGQ